VQDWVDGAVEGAEDVGGWSVVVDFGQHGGEGLELLSGEAEVVIRSVREGRG
jgi:hypothetical protein